jgi:hypothetical protein
MARITKQQQQDAADRIRELVTPGSTVYTVVRRTTRSNMAAYVSVYVANGGPELHRITHSLAEATGHRMDYGYVDAFKLDGLGTDRAFCVAQLAAWAAGVDVYSLKYEYL